MKYNFQVGDLFVAADENFRCRIAYISEVKKCRYSTDYVLNWIDKSGVYAKVPCGHKALEQLTYSYTYHAVTK